MDRYLRLYSVHEPSLGYTWNEKYFPNPEEFIGRLHDKGISVTLNLHPSAGCHPHEKAYKDFAKFLGLDESEQKPIEFDVTDTKVKKNSLCTNFISSWRVILSFFIDLMRILVLIFGGSTGNKGPLRAFLAWTHW